MDRKTYFYIGEGVLRSFILSLVLILLYSVVMSFAPLNSSVTSTYILVLTLLSVLYGTIYATRKIKRRGWIIGITVAVLYVIILYLVAVIAGRSPALAMSDILRMLLAVLVGALSGMLGINL